MGTPNYPKNLGDEFRQLKRDVKNAYTSSNMRKGMQKIGAKLIEVAGQLNIRGGTFNVYDDQNNLKAQIGKLDDGTYDLVAVKNGTARVSLSTLAFGMQADHRSGSFTPSSGGDYESLGGPQVTTTIGNTGKALLLVSGSLACDRDEWISLAVYGTRVGGGDYGPSIGLDLGNKQTSSATLGGSIVANIGTSDLATDLSPGEWTFEVKFRSVFGIGTPECTQATLVVMPF